MQQSKAPESIGRSSQVNDERLGSIVVPNVAVILLERSGRIRYTSQGIQLLLGISAQNLIGKQVRDLLPSLFVETIPVNTNLAYLHARSAELDWQQLEVKGRLLNVRITPTEIGGQELLVLEMRSNEAAQNQRDLQRLILALGDWDEMLVVTDISGKITYVNQAFEMLTGFNSAQVVGKTQEQILGCEENRSLYEEMWSRLLAGGSFRAIFFTRRNETQRFYEERYARPFINDAGEVTNYIFTSRDVSEQQRQILHLAHIANHDELTGLPNRHLFMDRLQQAQAHAARQAGGFCLLLLDLDDFKAVNDLYGHIAGDAVLMAVAERLRSCVREVDTFARLGGDEFAIILSDTTVDDDVQKVIEKIMVALRIDIYFNNLSITTHASIGAAYFPSDSLNSDGLLNAADVAMYSVKSCSGNGYEYFHRRRGNLDGAMTERKYKISQPQYEVLEFCVGNTQMNRTMEKEESK